MKIFRGKHFCKIASVFAAILFAFSFLSCSDGSDSASTLAQDGAKNAPKTDGELSSMTSREFAAAMTVGWNLGNTLDVHDNSKRKENLGIGVQAWWGMKAPTEAMIKKVAEKGFKTIRVPVSWHNHITDEKYTIDREWMAHVKKVVGWAIDAGMFVILNVHHDNLTAAQMDSLYGYCIEEDSALQEKSKAYLSAVWKQIADEFKNFDGHLVFEVLNEPRHITESDQGFNPDSDALKKWNPIIKDYEETCISAIRRTGGNNESRFIMVPFCVAHPTRSAGWSVPSDSASGKILISTHAYDPYLFAMSDDTNKEFTADFKGALEHLFKTSGGDLSKWVNQGYGVVMGEASASDKNNTDGRKKWIGSYFTLASKLGIPVIIWDNGITLDIGDAEKRSVGECHGWFNRETLEWFYPSLVDEIIEKGKPVAVSSGTEPSKNEPLEIAALAGKKTSWGNDISVGTEYAARLKVGSKVSFTVANNTDSEGNAYCKFRVTKNWAPCGVSEYYDASTNGKIAVEDAKDEAGNPNGTYENAGSVGAGSYYFLVTAENLGKLNGGFDIMGNFTLTKLVLSGLSE